MATQKPVEWVSALIIRFEEQLPCRTGPQTQHSRYNVEQNKECLIQISRYKFSLVISGLHKILQKVNDMRPHGPDFEKNYYESLLIVLDTLEKCLSSQPKDTTRDEAMNVKILLRETCQFIDLPNDNPMVVQLKNLASKVLFALSLNNFSAVFNRISVRLQELSTSSTDENPDYSDIELIQHINVDVHRLIKLLNETIQKFRCLRKNAQIVLMNSLEKAIWNWMDTYPNEFADLQKRRNEELAKCCEMMFEHLESFAENNKRRAAVWPLQIMLLVLSPKVLEEIVNADAGAPCSQRHFKKKQFIDQLKKALIPHSIGKHLNEAAAVTCVKLCKIATYININDSNNVVFTLVQGVISELKNLLFNTMKPFSRGVSYTCQDVDLMIDCFVSLFRILPHNNEALKVCLNPNSNSIYHYVLVSSLFRIITQPRLPWWPQIDIVYNKSSELRSMFTETLNKVTQGYISHTALRMIHVNFTLKDKMPKFKDKSSDDSPSFKNLLLWMVRLIHADPMLMLNNQGKAGHEIQSSTLELINGLVSLVHNPSMPDVAAEAMEALLVLHQPEKIEMWNPEAPINTFWDVSSQVLFSISQKLIQHQIANYTEILKWLRDILVCRNAFLLRHKDYANCNIGAHIAICKQAHIKLEVVFLMYLWSIDIDGVQVAMSCFALLCEEADIRCVWDEVTATVTYLLPNYHVYQELAAASAILTTGRAALQKRIMALLRKIDKWTSGCIQAWEDTYINWENATKALVSYPKARLEDGPMPDSFHRTVCKRRPSHQSSEHEMEIQDQVNEWANMTGFLCALGGVCLLGKSPSRQVSSSALSTLDHRNKPPALPCPANQDMQYCPVTQFVGHLLKLLVCNNEKFGTQIQKHVKELVGHEMSPLLYPILFDQTKVIVDKFFDQQGQVIVSDLNTQFIEHIIFIMKNVLENKTDHPSEHLGVTSIEPMMLAIVRYVRHLDITVHTLHIKTKLCQLVEVMMQRRDDLAFRQEMKFRNKMVDYLTDWVMGNSHQIAPTNTIDVASVSNMYVTFDISGCCRDLDQACMEAVAALLRGLPLQPEESDRGDQNEAKSQLFLKYFTLFMNLLNDCMEAQEVSVTVYVI
ncbi:hypothetical protein Pmani_022180 [Petrolisthes manimaculis]|uniref:Neurofibromin n=1 Tax=Petrolisthes manimaculis TaxID=1843537 RepID=A0AAE1U4M7_9EUCA|nr:hypothetical protein Pmani_022180 [Petrolisthes manimaculis]